MHMWNYADKNDKPFGELAHLLRILRTGCALKSYLAVLIMSWTRFIMPNLAAANTTGA